MSARNLTPEHIEAMQAGRKKRTDEERRERLSDILANHPCSCGLTTGTTDRELRTMGAGCTAPWYVCPTLDSIRRVC